MSDADPQPMSIDPNAIMTEYNTMLWSDISQDEKFEQTKDLEAKYPEVADQIMVAWNAWLDEPQKGLTPQPPPPDAPPASWHDDFKFCMEQVHMPVPEGIDSAATLWHIIGVASAAGEEETLGAALAATGVAAGEALAVSAAAWAGLATGCAAGAGISQLL